MIELRPYEDRDRALLAELLESSGLTTIGLHEDASLILVASDESGLVGCAAIERYGDSGLLRSVATAERIRGTGAGTKIVSAAERAAYVSGARRLYLLTETAEGFFSRLGYDVIERAVVPEAVRASTQFATLCPASATAMARTLNG